MKKKNILKAIRKSCREATKHLDLSTKVIEDKKTKQKRNRSKEKREALEEYD